MDSAQTPEPRSRSQRRLLRLLDVIEWAGNKLPDPALLFVLILGLTWLLSAWLAQYEFTELDPRTLGPGKTAQPLVIKNQLTPEALTVFLTKMVTNFTSFPPLGVVLVALLGVGVAEHTGLISAWIKGLLSLTPQRFLTPMLLLVAIISHTAGDTGFVLVVPLGGVIFATAGRHPLAGIVCAFAGVAGGFSANFLVSGLDPLLQGFTQSAAHLIAPAYEVNPLCNYLFMATSSILIVSLGWILTDRVTGPRVAALAVDGAVEDRPALESLTAAEKRGVLAALLTLVLLGGLLLLACLPADSPLTNPLPSEGNRLPIMEAIIPFIFLFFLIPGLVFGYVAGTIRNHRDVVQGMSQAMGTMNYYLVLAFCAAQFVYAFNESNLGPLVAIKGAAFLRSLGLPPAATIIGIILLSALVNLLIGSASAKWALLSPIFVPMLMELGLSPELTQAAYRIGDSSTNIITPLLPYFPLVVVYAQRYVKNTGIGTLVALMLPYSATFLLTWTVLLLLFWNWNLPLGFPLDVGYGYGSAR